MRAGRKEKIMAKHNSVLDLCGGTGAWSAPYREAGYKVEIVDPIATAVGDNYQGTVAEFLLEIAADQYPPHYHMVLAAPPCTEFAGSGARWWKEKEQKSPQLLREALQIVIDCLEIIRLTEADLWALEQPVGRLPKLLPDRLGKPDLIFNPCDYGDPWTKKTCLWGHFNKPKKNPVEPTQGSKLHRLPPSKERAMLRSITPPGFARAFFEANQ
jgi:hypothetical protein